MNRVKLSLFGGATGANGTKSIGTAAPARRAPDDLSGLTPIERAFADTVQGAKAPISA